MGELESLCCKDENYIKFSEEKFLYFSNINIGKLEKGVCPERKIENLKFDNITGVVLRAPPGLSEKRAAHS